MAGERQVSDRVALGAVQAVGLVAVIEAVDVMCKTARVKIREIHDAG